MGPGRTPPAARRRVALIDTEWLEHVLLELLRTPTQVPFGETEVAPGDPRIARVAAEVVLPWLAELGPAEVRRHPLGDVAARFGPPGDDGLLIQTYLVSQHANLMDDTRAGSVVDGGELGLAGPCALGQGASQNKGPMASALAAVRARSTDLARPLWLAVNTEGRSSHGGSQRIIDDLGVRAAAGIIAFGTDLRVSLGNRGRVDVDITVRGRSCHSSQPWLGANPIEGAADVLRQLGSLPLPAEDGLLGPATATPYRLACFPVAPHTIPEEVRLVVDRRLLPGEDPERAVADVRGHVRAPEGFDVEVSSGTFMLPAVVGEDEPVVRALREGLEPARGAPAETFFSLNAFDAGYPCAHGIPTPMFGPGKRGFHGAGMLGTDAVALADCAAGAAAMAHAIERLCAEPVAAR